MTGRSVSDSDSSPGAHPEKAATDDPASAGSPIAPAKLNLHLRVLAREETGFHRIETVMVRIGLSDLLQIEVTGSDVSLDVDGDVGGVSSEDNLVVRAARSFLEATGIDTGVRIRLQKRIPAGAGLAGGSADAAETLKTLNRMHGSPVDAERLMALGAELGSDIPFMMSGLSPAFAWGRGERLMPLPALAGVRPAVLLALPGVHVDTGWAYRTLSSRTTFGPAPEILPLHSAEHTSSASLEAWRPFLARSVNDFLPLVHETYPELARLYDDLRAQNPVKAGMSGTGSAHFALFETDEKAQRAAATMRGLHPAVTFHVTSVT